MNTCHCILPWLIFNFSQFVAGEPISLLIGAGSAVAVGILSGLSYFARCKLYECCSDGWLLADADALRHAMRTRFYGQHLAQEAIIISAIAHFKNPTPKKALVMSFHGWTGCGKNYLTSMIAQSLYKKGLKSNYAHIFISTLHFSNHNDFPLYRAQIRSWIMGNVSHCARSLFVFDEVDKMPANVIDAIKPFIDHYEHLEGTDFRKSIFIFLSNSGGNEITQRALQYHEAGKLRNEITFKELEEIIISSAYNVEGGLKTSELISSHLIDHFVPFLPLERRHILLCIRDYMVSRKFEPTNERIAAIADTLQYFPKANPIYSSSGCKRVAQKAELFMSAEQEKIRRRLRQVESADDEL